MRGVFLESDIYPDSSTTGQDLATQRTMVTLLENAHSVHSRPEVSAAHRENQEHFHGIEGSESPDGTGER